MKRNKIVSKRYMEGGMFRDVELSKLPPDKYPYANNVDGGYGSEFFAKRAHDGTTLIGGQSFDANTSYETIGLFENKVDNSVIYFLYDSGVNSLHLIREYYDNTFVDLLKGSFLNFEPDRRIHSAVIIDGVLYWSDGVDLEGFVEGNAPRHINIDRHRYGKFLKYELLVNTDALTLNTTYSYTLLDLEGNITTGPLDFLTLPLGGPPYDSPMLAIFNALDATGFVVTPFDFNDPNDPATSVKFYWPVVNTRVQIEARDGNGVPEVILNELNFYPLPSSTSDFSEQITIIKPCPQYPLDISFEQDPIEPSGSIGKHAYKFRYRYIFVDNEKSAWGPYSQVPTNFSGSDSALADNDPAFNLIRLTFNANEKYVQQGWGHLVRKIEIGVFSSENSLLTRVDIININDFFIDQLEYEFKGQKTYPAVASDENADVDVQALKNYDHVPLIALGLESVYDESGNTLLLLGGGSFKYDLTTPVLDVSLFERILNDPLPNPQISENKALKRGGKYKVGVIVKDAWGRHNDVIKSYEIRVPWSKFFTPLLSWSVFHLQTEILTPLPAWGKFYQIVITENLNQSKYFQALSGNVDGFKFVTTDGQSFVIKSKGSADRPYIGFQLLADENFGTIHPDLGQLILFEDDQNTGNYKFIPVFGDRLHVMYWEGATWGAPAEGTIPQPIDVENYDYNIVGYLLYNPPSNPDQVEYYVLIDNPGVRFDSPLASGTPMIIHLEIYTPKTSVADDFFYEFGNPVPITGSTDLDITHSWFGDTYIGGQEQITIPVVDFGNADSEFEERDFSAREWPTLDKNDTESVNDLGRIVAFDAEYKETYRKNIISFSDTTQPNSEIRGASAFRGTNFVRVAERWGPVRKLVFNQNVLLAIMSFKTQPVYVAKDRLMDLSGGSFVGRAERLFNIADELMLDMGVLFAESVVYEQGQTFGFDVATGRVWRYTTGGGQVAISDAGLITTAQGYASQIDMKNIRGVHIKGGYRRSHESFYLNHPTGSVIFKNKDKQWISFNDINPEGMISIGLDTYVFNLGFIHLIEPAALKANYFGVQYDVQIDVIINDQIDIVKHFDSAELDSDVEWYSHDMTIPANTSYATMQSEIPLSYWKAYEGRWKADLLRDKNDPEYKFAIIVDPNERAVTAMLRGRHMRGQYLRFKIRLATPGAGGVLRAIYLNWIPSQAALSV